MMKSTTKSSANNDNVAERPNTAIFTFAEQPKRPLSAYNYFFKSERARLLGLTQPKLAVQGSTSSEDENGEVIPKPKRRHRKVHGAITFRDMANQVGSRWKILNDEERAPFLNLFQQDRARYKAEMKAWNDRQKKRAKALKKQQESQETSVAVKLGGTPAPVQAADPQPPKARKTKTKKSVAASKTSTISLPSLPPLPDKLQMHSLKSSFTSAVPGPTMSMAPAPLSRSRKSKKKPTEEFGVYDIFRDTPGLNGQAKKEKKKSAKAPSTTSFSSFYDITMDMGGKREEKQEEPDEVDQAIAILNQDNFGFFSTPTPLSSNMNKNYNNVYDTSILESGCMVEQQRKRKRAPHQDLRQNHVLNDQLHQFLNEEQQDEQLENVGHAENPMLNEADFDEFFDRFDFEEDDNTTETHSLSNEEEHSQASSNAQEENYLSPRLLQSSEMMKRLNSQIQAMQAAMESSHKVVKAMGSSYKAFEPNKSVDQADDSGKEIFRWMNFDAASSSQEHELDLSMRSMVDPASEDSMLKQLDDLMMYPKHKHGGVLSLQNSERSLRSFATSSQQEEEEINPWTGFSFPKNDQVGFVANFYS